MQTYSDPSRASDPHALPDVEVFYVTKSEAAIHRADYDNGTYDYLDYCPASEPGWYYWFCFPGCLPDSGPIGPFATATEAEAAAQEDCAD
jgi:hypothetical protein